MRYVPNYTGEDISLNAEFRQIAEVLESLSLHRLPNSMQAPESPQEGQVIWTDGVAWNPGEGSGVYVYTGASWIKLGLDRTDALIFFQGV